MAFSLGEMAVVVVVALVVIGPDKLPNMAKTIGKGYGEFRRAFNDFKKTVDVSMDEPKSRSSGGSSAKQTYKSRWEEQAADEPVKTEGEATVVETVETAPVDGAENTGPVRAKRGDLIKEDNDGSNG